jgi:hypothetical protein
VYGGAPNVRWVELVRYTAAPKGVVDTQDIY